MDQQHPVDCTLCPGTPGSSHVYVSPAVQERRMAAAADANARFEAARQQAAEQRAADIARARRLSAEGASLYAIASELGRTKEWLREYAGLR